VPIQTLTWKLCADHFELFRLHSCLWKKSLVRLKNLNRSRGVEVPLRGNSWVLYFQPAAICPLLARIRILLPKTVFRKKALAAEHLTRIRQLFLHDYSRGKTAIYLTDFKMAASILRFPMGTIWWVSRTFSILIKKFNLKSRLVSMHTTSLVCESKKIVKNLLQQWQEHRKAVWVLSILRDCIQWNFRSHPGRPNSLQEPRRKVFLHNSKRSFDTVRRDFAAWNGRFCTLTRRWAEIMDWLDTVPFVTPFARV